MRPQRIIRALVACGLVVDHQTGSHVILWKAGLKRPVSVARHQRELPPGVVAKILKQADVDPEEFLKHV